MGIDGKISKYLTDRHFSKLLRRMKTVGVKFVPDTEQLRHRSFEVPLMPSCLTQELRG